MYTRVQSRTRERDTFGTDVVDEVIGQILQKGEQISVSSHTGQIKAYTSLLFALALACPLSHQTFRKSFHAFQLA